MTRRAKLVLVLVLAVFVIGELIYLWSALQPAGQSPDEAPGVPSASTPAGAAARPPGVGSIGAPGGTGVASGNGGDAEPDVYRLLAAEPPARDLADLAVRMGRVSPAAPAAAMPADAGPRRVGDEQRFWLHDINSEQYFTVTARLEVVAPNAYLWVQHDNTFDRAAVERGAKGFSDDVYAKVRAVFGGEWSPGLDGDPRLHILHHEPIAGIAGYFYSADEYPAAVEPHSNQREMFYINLDATTPGSYQYQALLAHELQHMIHWNHDRDEAVWVNEGLSELAPRLAGYPAQNGGAFFAAPDTALLEWEHAPGANTAHYAAAYAFFAYLRQRYGDAVIGAIVDAPGNSAAGVEAAIRGEGQPEPFERVFLDWVVANLGPADGPGDAGRRYGYGDLETAAVQPEPLPSIELRATVAQYGTDYYDATPRVRDGRLRLGFAADATIGLLEPVPARAGAIWWSARGDNMDSRLTRAFDLTGARAAALTFQMWSDLEDNWDYAYFLASADGGATWQRLATSRTTDVNPNGNNFGGGLTGSSGTWVGETLDLAAFAGRRVLVRFEVVTDDAVSLSGLALDDIRLDAVGFRDDAETDAGWVAEGWVRLDPRLPTRWGLQVVVESPTTGLHIYPVAVRPDGSATIDVAGIPGDATVTLSVSGLTPGTRNAVGYQLR